MLLTLGIVTAVIGLVPVVGWIVDNNRIAAKNKRNMEKYEDRRARERHVYQDAVIEYDHKIREWEKNNDAAHSILEEPLEKSRRLLKQFYNIGKIYPKYHNLPALTSIYEYFITGRCDELTGPHGA